METVLEKESLDDYQERLGVRQEKALLHPFYCDIVGICWFLDVFLLFQENHESGLQLN